jgi:hypothetical protein
MINDGTGNLSSEAQLAVSRGGTGAATAGNNLIFAGPTSGGPSAPAFRGLAASDIPAPAGDISGTYAAVTVSKIQGTAVSATAPTTGQVLSYNGTNWIPSVAGTGDVVNNGQTGAVTVGTNNATALTLETNNSPRLTVDSSGNIGIGVTSPATIDAALTLFPAVIPKLEIMSGANTGTYEEAMVLRHTNTDATGVLRRLGFLMKMSSEGAGESIKMAGMVLDSSNAWSNNPYLHLVTNDQKRMTITDAGNVGIGTTAPAAGLDIATLTTASAVIVPRDTTSSSASIRRD